MTRNPQIEILAPVGDREMLTAAVYSGADAVYLGFSGLNARSGAANFDRDTLGQAVAFCHGRGVKVHVAINTTLYAGELAAAADAVRAVAAAGADAVICQDLAAAALCRDIAPDLPRHGSTQMSVHSLSGALQLAEMGYTRVVLARELTFAEIEHITKHCGIETEVFVHGALCMSVSGQCYLSAFLGGRSGNRGSCAGPCRLPFDASPLPEGVPGRCHHLSLKDNSIIDRLDKLQAMGVASAKIEGRLRTPEYVAAAVNACRAGREGRAFDPLTLEKAFSRSGFTSAWPDGRISGAMFGTRSEAQAAETKKALPALRELFRRECQKVPVTLKLEVEEFGAKLTVTDADGSKAAAYGMDEPAPAQNDPAPALRRSLEKCGGTPFLPTDIQIEMDGGPWYLPGSAVNELRRQALDALLKKRETLRPWAVQPYTLPALPAHPAVRRALWARFDRWAQVPADSLDGVERIILPIAEWEAVPQALRPITILELPRLMFGPLEKQTAGLINASKDAGFAGYQADNIAHIQLCLNADVPVYGGMGLNLTNPLAAQEYADLYDRVAGLLVLPEVKDTDIAAIAPARGGSPVPTGAIVYGHLPLMFTRACPLQNITDCARCPKKGELTDRKARKFPVLCGLGVRTVYNPVALYMGDKPDALAVDYGVAYFTTETADRAARVLALLKARRPYDGEFTRGLYFKGTN